MTRMSLMRKKRPRRLRRREKRPLLLRSITLAGAILTTHPTMFLMETCSTTTGDCHTHLPLRLGSLEVTSLTLATSTSETDTTEPRLHARAKRRTKKSTNASVSSGPTTTPKLKPPPPEKMTSIWSKSEKSCIRTAEASSPRTQQELTDALRTESRDTRSNCSLKLKLMSLIKKWRRKPKNS